MREARAADHRRRAYSRAYPVTLRQFVFANLPSLGDGELRFEPGPTLICGGNGVGKSSILHAIYCTLTGSHKGSARALRRLEGGEFVIRVRTPTGDLERRARIENGAVVADGDEFPYPVFLFDLGVTCPEWLTLFSETANLDELLATLAPSISEGDDLEEIRYLIGKNYTERAVYEVEELGEETIPYFQVRTPTARYASEDMGLGELALHVLYWQLTNAPENSVLLIEEPETFISPRSQRALVDLVCKYCETRGLCTVLTSHSLGIVGRLPREHVSLLYHGDAGRGVVTPPRAHQLNEVLGVPVRPIALLLVEDEAARLLTALLIDRLDPDLRFVVQIQVVAGTEGINDALKGLPHNDLIRLVGVYDGGHVVNVGNHKWGHVNLPGPDAPEHSLRQALTGRERELATLAGRPEADVVMALAAVEGRDDHDWAPELAAQLGVSMERVFEYLLDIWLSVAANSGAAAQFCDAVRVLVHT